MLMLFSLQRKDFDYDSTIDQLLCGFDNDTAGDSIQKSDSSILYAINGLRPNTKYTISVFAINTKAPSRKTIEDFTDKTRMFNCFCYQLHVCIS